MSRRIFCDTSFFYACLDPSDANHAAAGEALATFKNATLSCTWDIVSETITLLRYRSHYKIAARFIDRVLPHLNIIEYDSDVRKEALRVFKKFSRDKRLSLCDCISFVILTAVIPQTQIITFDSDFRRCGFVSAVMK